MSNLIDRQQAIDAIDKCAVWIMYAQGDSQKDETEFAENIIKQTKMAIRSMLREDLPSAQPEIIRCKDCKYYGIAWLKKDGTDDRRYKNSVCLCGKYAVARKANWYCADAERRTDG